MAFSTPVNLLGVYAPTVAPPIVTSGILTFEATPTHPTIQFPTVGVEPSVIVKDAVLVTLPVLPFADCTLVIVACARPIPHASNPRDKYNRFIELSPLGT